MRIAFLAVAAPRNECRRPIRKSRHRSSTGGQIRKFASTKRILVSVLASIFEEKNQHNSHSRSSLDTYWHLSNRYRTSHSGDHHRINRLRKFTSIRRRQLNEVSKSSSCTSYVKPWPLLAFWHLTSLILFIIATTLALSAKASDQSSTMNEQRSVMWMQSIFNDHEFGPYMNDDEDDPYRDSCHPYDYLLSPQAYISPSSSGSSGGNLVRRSIREDHTTKSVQNSLVDNVLNIWLRASQRHGTSDHRSSDSDDDDDQTWTPVQRPRTRHRIQHYRNAQNSRSSSTKKPTSTAKPQRSTLNGTGSSRNRTGQSIPKKPPPSNEKSAKKIPQCKLFDERSVDELCSLQPSARLQALRHYYLRMNMAKTSDSSGELLNSNILNLTLYDFFALNVQTDAHSIYVISNHLSKSRRSCLRSSALSANERNITNSTNQCRVCFMNLSRELGKIDSDYDAFSRSVLSMIDCEPDNDLERFSPTSNCSDCKMWYKRWLLVRQSGIWQQKPCLQWCHLAELACPHLMPVRRTDYAGLPSFRCTDPEVTPVPSPKSIYGDQCNCFHPCDEKAPTVRWGWRNISAELKDFCRDYKKKEKILCPSKYNKSASKSSSNIAEIRWLWIWILSICTIFIRSYGR